MITYLLVVNVISLLWLILIGQSHVPLRFFILTLLCAPAGLSIFLFKDTTSDFEPLKNIANNKFQVIVMIGFIVAGYIFGPGVEGKWMFGEFSKLSHPFTINEASESNQNTIYSQGSQNSFHPEIDRNNAACRMLAETIDSIVASVQPQRVKEIQIDRLVDKADRMGCLR